MVAKFIKFSPMLTLLCTILLSNQILADEASEEYPNLSCHEGYNTPDNFGLVIGPFTKREALDSCNGHTAINNHECYRQCMMESLFVVRAEDYSKNGFEWNYEIAKLVSEDEMIEGMRNRLFFMDDMENDTASRLAKEIHLKCSDKAIKLATRPCKEWKPFNDCVDSIWLCGNHTFVSESEKPKITKSTVKVSTKNPEKNLGIGIQNGKVTIFLFFTMVILLTNTIGL